ncbi:hypothetical protein DQ04_09301020 [Trypanosoma grayi]|uniref:hypothetical protein n=1 Tax=Trypanosoma grayi TaxID=71804 RepID=UPI0004F48AA4|nr:hypothetical protein DQ04_09301020 [Trypanosoma grayi]KEG07605.1 hypothetical protein DQ04_09301020 [Trypanosoma grayi]
MEPAGVPVALPEDRFNGSPAALGKLRRTRWCGVTCIWSPDAAVYCVPTLITLTLVFGVVFTLWDELGLVELCVLFALLSVAFTSSLLVVSTDPGVYPRLRPAEVDPFHNDRSLVYCRVCALRRPPRTSHCYQCNVCVWEHDHHCGIIGGCVGQRSLRWFTLYLLTTSGASSMGVFWVCRSLFTGAFAVASRRQFANGIPRNRSASVLAMQNERDDDAVKPLVVVTLLVLLLLVVFLVGSLAIFYVYLVLTSTTRRESQRMESKPSTLLQPKIMWDNLMHVFHPPRSMLIARNDEISPLV